MVEGHGAPRQDRERREPQEQAQLAESVGRREEADEGKRKGEGRGVHEGVTPPEARPPLVGERARERVGDGVEQKGDEERGAGERTGQFEHLVVVEKDEQPEAGVFQSLGKLPDAERQFARERDDAIVRVVWVHPARSIAARQSRSRRLRLGRRRADRAGNDRRRSLRSLRRVVQRGPREGRRRRWCDVRLGVPCGVSAVAPCIDATG